MSKFLQLLPWDSEFLGFSVGRLLSTTPVAELPALLEQARQDGYRLLNWAVPPEDAAANAAACAAGGFLADEKITYAMRIEEVPTELPAGVQPTTTLTSQLTALALQAGHRSRYQTDPRFERDVYQRLYSLWIANSLEGEMAREVLVFRPDASAAEAGLLTLGIKNTRADIGLLAVDAQVRGQAIGARLLTAARQRTRAWGFDALQVVTQRANVGACRFYERCGFTPDVVENIYHLWLY
ncbi:GNAT family N-acetyltransferase [Hymenobacter sp. UYP22]|uniref:GNAT family N-acetyltransferase n=1 Tax=Hymenobacter sp. UYP22 TaxID=3156348 RepID=UPI0033996940